MHRVAPATPTVSVYTPSAGALLMSVYSAHIHSCMWPEREELDFFFTLVLPFYALFNYIDVMRRVFFYTMDEIFNCVC